jgi:hypothetical protein
LPPVDPREKVIDSNLSGASSDYTVADVVQTRPEDGQIRRLV